MPIGNIPPEGIGGPGKIDPVPTEVLRIAEEIKERAKLVIDKGYILDALAENDTRKEKYRTEIRDEVGHMQRELRNVRDYKDELSENAYAALEKVDADINDINQYLDGDWPAFPYGTFVDDVDTLYTQLVG